MQQGRGDGIIWGANHAQPRSPKRSKVDIHHEVSTARSCNGLPLVEDASRKAPVWALADYTKHLKLRKLYLRSAHSKGLGKLEELLGHFNRVYPSHFDNGQASREFFLLDVLNQTALKSEHLLKQHESLVATLHLLLYDLDSEPGPLIRVSMAGSRVEPTLFDRICKLANNSSNSRVA